MTIKVRKKKRKYGFKSKRLILILATIIALIFSTLIIMPMPSYKELFKTLSEMQHYAAKTNENTPMENSDTLRPEFTNYYKSQIPSFSQKIKYKIIWILSKINLTRPVRWDASAFKTILEELGTTRQQSGMRDNFVYRIQTQPNAKIAVFGNIQGSFHSFVRDLGKLKELGFIDESLKITQPHNYIIMIGDVIDRSPFTLETLTVAMRLMQVNQNNVIYLRGNHESNNYWQEHTLKNELQIRASDLSQGAIPLEMEVNRFFNTLPLATYLASPSEPNEFVRISDAGRESSTILNEANYADILVKKTDAGATYFAIKENADASEARVKVKVIIRGEKKRKTFQKNEGLRYLPPDLDSVAWTILSCPNIVYQKALNFYSDAFIIISAAEKVSDWEVSLYTRDLRTKDPFKEIKYNFISGLDLESHKKMAAMATTAAPQTTTPTQPTNQPITQTVAPQPVTQQTQTTRSTQPVSQTQPQIQTQQPQATTTPQQVRQAQPQPQLLQTIPENENPNNQTTTTAPSVQQSQPTN